MINHSERAMSYFTPEALFDIAREYFSYLTEGSIGRDMAVLSLDIRKRFPLPPERKIKSVKFDIFLSHSSIDKRRVDLAYLALTAMGTRSILIELWIRNYTQLKLRERLRPSYDDIWSSHVRCSLRPRPIRQNPNGCLGNWDSLMAGMVKQRFYRFSKNPHWHSMDRNTLSCIRRFSRARASLRSP
jgi:hypothetical protein